MKNPNSTDSQGPTHSAAASGLGFSPWQQLKNKRISYFALPLLVMATVVEFVILATGWKYQQVACLPQGMRVTFFGIGPIGATILAVELLKLPLAVWTAARQGWQKTFMLFVGLPLICVLTFQLVKDMAVYEMGVAMTPASQWLQKASTEEIRISHLNGELAAIEAKKTDRERKLTELAAKKAKAKAELEESLKRNDESRQDAISLTDYQKKELSEVEIRQANLIKQFNADTEQLTKTIAELRARRETELPRATEWNAEEARIENVYKAKLAAYTNKKTAYDKDKAEYESASFLMRQVMRQPVDPGVPPERAVNTILKPTLLTEMDAQIKAKEAELLAVNTKRRDTIAQVGEDARQIRGDFDRRSLSKRAETDRKREELLAAQAALAAEWKAEEKQMDQELALAVQKVDGMRAEVDAARKKAEGYYEAREAAIRNTQVHRIATTVEIVRGLIFGERPMSITMTAKERGDILTDQISMVRIWVYPVLAFIVAFLPTLMVEIGMTTIFHRDDQPQKKRRRFGLFGQGLHQFYIRAGRIKMLRLERTAKEASSQIAARDRALATAKGTAERALAEKEAELQAAREAIATATTTHEEQLKWMKAEHEEQSKEKEAEWIGKFAGLAESLNRTVAEKDALADFQKSEIERQVQQRQNSWSDRITQLRQELDSQRAAHEAERTAMIQEHHQKLLATSEDCQAQIVQARRQAADAELAAQQSTAKLAYDLKEARDDRDGARSQLQQQTESLTFKLTQGKDEAVREMDKALRQEKYRAERQQLEFNKTLREKAEESERQLKQREQELTLEADARLAKEQTRLEQDARRREEEYERELEARVREVDARWNQELQQQGDTVQFRLKQREQELTTRASQELRRRELELERQLETQAREAEARLKQEAQQKEQAFQARLKQREQELAAKEVARETELQNQWTENLRLREEEWERQAEARIRATEARLGQETRQKEEIFEVKMRQREQQLQAEFDARQAELQTQTQHFHRRREEESADAGQRALRELELHLRQEMQQKEEALLAKAKQREQELLVQLNAQTECHKQAQLQWETEFTLLRRNLEPLNERLARTEQERDEALQFATEHVRKVQVMEEKLTEASSLLTGWKNGNGNGNGKSPASAKGGRDIFEVTRAALAASGDH